MLAADTAWILTSTALVLFMTLPGLALFYAGLVQTKNVLSVLMQTFSIACLMSVLWFAFGYSIAFGDGGTGQAIWGSLEKIFFVGVARDALSGSLPESLFAMFQMTFAIITPALIVGAWVERAKFSAVLIFTALWSLLVYAPVTHWIWGGGWLAGLGVMDFAGGIVVHATAGISALVFVSLVGSRRGFPAQLRPAHSPALTMVGAAMLWVGWFGFNAGSALGANADAAMAMLVTHLSATVASLVWVLTDHMRGIKPSLVGIVTGMVAGLATITPASGFVGPFGALILGCLAGVICNLACGWVKSGLKLDDSLDVFAVHGVGGIMGSLLVPFLAIESLGGAGVENVWSQLWVQALAVGAVVLYSAILSFVILKGVQALVGLRVDQESEAEGLDISEHNERETAL